MPWQREDLPHRLAFLAWCQTPDSPWTLEYTSHEAPTRTPPVCSAWAPQYMRWRCILDQQSASILHWSAKWYNKGEKWLGLYKKLFCSPVKALDKCNTIVCNNSIVGIDGWPLLCVSYFPLVLFSWHGGWWWHLFTWCVMVSAKKSYSFPFLVSHKCS